MRNILIPSLIFILLSWAYAYFLYFKIISTPKESTGDLQWKLNFIKAMHEQSALIGKRTKVSEDAVHHTLDQMTREIQTALTTSTKNQEIQINIPRNGIQLSADYQLSQIKKNNFTRTRLLFPEDYYPIYGQHHSQKNVIIYIHSSSSSSQSLESARQFIQSLRATQYDGDIILTLTPSDYYSQQEYRNYLQSENIIVYPYLINCSLNSRQQCLYFDSFGTSDHIKRTIPQINTMLFEYFLKFYSLDSSALLISGLKHIHCQNNPFQSPPQPNFLFQNQQLTSNMLNNSDPYLSSCLSPVAFNSLISKSLLSDQYYFGTIKSLKYLLETLRSVLFHELPCWTTALESQQLLLTYLFEMNIFPTFTSKSQINPLLADQNLLNVVDASVVPACVYNHHSGYHSASTAASKSTNWTINLIPPNRRGKKIHRPKGPRNRKIEETRAVGL